MQIHVDSNTSALELYHLSVLFQSLAKAYGFEVQAASTKLEDFTVKLNIDTTEATTAIDALAAHAASKGVDVVEPVTVSVGDMTQAPTPSDIQCEQQMRYISQNEEIQSRLARVTDTNLDSSGLPWDARIHAGSRERNTDGSWRVRRRPKGVEEADWDATIARVTAELTDLMSIPVSSGAVADAAAEEALTDADIDAFVDIVGGITDEPEVIEPPAIVAPPVVLPPVTITPPAAVAPPITVDKPAIETFAQLMSWLTSRTPKDEAAKPAMVTRVNEILAANGLTTLQQLGQRSDLIPQVLVQFKEAFGE